MSYDDDAILVALKEYAADVHGVEFYQKPTPLMRVFDLFVGRFNKRFMSHYTTTVGTRVYWPTVRRSSYQQYRTLAHELVHVEQKRKHGALRYTLSYISPQVGAVLCLGALGALGAFWCVWCLFSLVFVLAGVCLFLPSTKRAEYEFEAYQMSHAVMIWRGDLATIPTPHRVETFVGPDYLWMCRDRDKVRARLVADIEEVRSGDFERRSKLARSVRVIMQGCLRR